MGIWINSYTFCGIIPVTVHTALCCTVSIIIPRYAAILCQSRTELVIDSIKNALDHLSDSLRACVCVCAARRQTTTILAR